MSSQRNDVTLWGWGSFKFSITHVVTNALCFNNVLNGGWTSTWSSLPVGLELTSWSGFAVCLVSESAKQYSLAIWLKSSRCPVLLSCLSICIRWCVSFCSGKCVVCAVVTKLLASVRIWISTISPLTSARRARRNKHVPKHFMRALSSATVVDWVVVVILWLSKSIMEPRVRNHLKSLNRNRIVGVCSLMAICGLRQGKWHVHVDWTCHYCFGKMHRAYQEYVVVLSVAKNVRQHNDSSRFFKVRTTLLIFPYISDCRTRSSWGTAGKLVTKMDLSSTLQPV